MFVSMTDPGGLIRDRRLAHGLTQAQLAVRAGTTQSALSRLERGELSPTIATIDSILFVLGETIEVGARRSDGDYDEAHLAGLLARSPAERLGPARPARPHPRCRQRDVTRRETPLDAARILQTLFEHEVSYTVIGGLAVQAHGHTRTTQDVNLVPAPDPENVGQLADALGALGARPAGETRAWSRARLGQALTAREIVSLDTDVGGVDVHMRPPGAAPYDVLRARALVIEVAGVTVAIASRDDLIAMKRASGRPIDRGDIMALTALEHGDRPRAG